MSPSSRILKGCGLLTGFSLPLSKTLPSACARRGNGWFTTFQVPPVIYRQRCLHSKRRINDASSPIHLLELPLCTSLALKLCDVTKGAFTSFRHHPATPRVTLAPPTTMPSKRVEDFPANKGLTEQMDRIFKLFMFRGCSTQY